MRRIIVSIFALYYLIGNLVFQGGDFSQMSDLSSMYKNCKETEDKNLTVLDFFTEHVIDLDCFFDEHETDTNEKPHKPIQKLQTAQSFQVAQKQTTLDLNPPIEYLDFVKPIGIYNSNYHFQNITSIFHPPATV